MTHRPWIALLSLLAAAVGAARAQAPDTAAPPRYEVEVLVFAHADFDPSEELFELEQVVGPSPTGPGTAPPLLEPFPTVPFGAPDPLDIEAGAAPPAGANDEPAGAAADDLAPIATPPGDAGAEAAAPPDELRSVLDVRTGGPSLRFRPLAPEELQLTDHYRTLDRLGAYRPLLHVGWVQEVLSERDARPFDLALLGAVTPSGTVRVHQSRFLHVTLDLAYRPDVYGAAPSFGLGEVALAPTYRIRTQRRISSNAVHYFDHPAFGVLIVVRPVPPPTPREQPARPAA